MFNKPCVSVIVPIYNQEKYLDISIQGILKQTYSNLQIILVNDGSTDSSDEILWKYADKDNRIQIIEKENGGLIDATLSGLAVARGEYTCFLDPDDQIGYDFVETFIKHMSEGHDFVAAGFYFENQGIIKPYYLRKEYIFNKKELLDSRDYFLYELGNPDISNLYFISRWNKMYRTKMLQKVANDFSKYKHITLGEDTIFTYLVLCYSQSGKTISAPNSYYYNIYNPHSMMNSGKLETYLKKSELAYEALKELCSKFYTSEVQAYVLYYFLVDGLFTKLYQTNIQKYEQIVRKLQKDLKYQYGEQEVEKSFSRKQKLKKQIRRCFGIAKCERCEKKFYQFLKKKIFEVRCLKNNIVFFEQKCVEKGLMRAIRLLGFQIDRQKAFEEMPKRLPEIEEKIVPILKKYLSMSSDLEQCPIERNVFVFWWDGFLNAPAIVKKCFESVKQYHSDYNIIPIDKDNYKKYTDIAPDIIDAFDKDKISVQTFSDILRFNLLKNNGGVWIDATIFFLSECNLIEELRNKSFVSLSFSTSAQFLEYEGVCCSWSGFFIASRKNGIFVKAVDEIFKQYYLENRSYTTYFFIDIVMMICKKYQLDDDVLNKTIESSKSMFALANLLNEPFDYNAIEFMKDVPQKLQWNVNQIKKEGTYLEWLLE